MDLKVKADRDTLTAFKIVPENKFTYRNYTFSQSFFTVITGSDFSLTS
jgi:hypothetical protein